MKHVSNNRRVALAAISLLAFGLFASAAPAQGLKEKVARDGKITIGIYNSWPFGYVKDNQIQGIGPDVLKQATKELGVKEVEYQVLEFGALIPSLMAKRIDVVAGGMYITPGRCKQVAFSNPMGGPQGNAILVKAGNPLAIHGYQDMASNAKVRVGNLRGAASLEYMAAAGVPKDRIQLFEDHQTGLAALLAGRVDMLINSTGPVIGSLRDPAVKGLERAEPFKEVVDGKEMIHYTAYAFRPEDGEFRDAFNGALAKVGASVKAAFIENGFTVREGTPATVTAKELCGADYK